MTMQSVGVKTALTTIALGANCAIAVAQSAATVTYHKVIISTDTGQSGWNGELVRMSPPAINESGDLAFEGETNAADGLRRGVWFGDFVGAAYTVSKIAQEGDVFTHSFPGFSGSVSVQYTLDTPLSPSTAQGAIGFSLPIIDSAGRVAFIGSIVSPDAMQGESVLFRTDSAQAPVAIAGAPFRKVVDMTTDGSARFHHRWFNVEGVDYRFKSHLALPRTGDGTLAWYSNLETIDPADTDDVPAFLAQSGAVIREGGVFVGATATSHAEIVRYQDPVPNATLTYGNLSDPGSVNWFGSPVLNQHGDAAFRAIANDGSGVITASDASTGLHRVVAQDGDLLPGAPSDSSVSDLASPVINDSGAIAFRAVFDSQSLGGAWEGVWAENQFGALQPVAVGTTSSVPDEPSAIWGTFGDPVVNGSSQKAFAARFLVGGGWQQGLYRADASNVLEPVAREGQLTPFVPNTTLMNRQVGVFEGFAHPLLNDTGNAAFVAEVDVTDSVLAANLGSLTVPIQFVKEEGIFFEDHNGVLRTIVATGMTVHDMLNNGDQRVLIDLRFSSDAFQIVSGSLSTKNEGTGSGHQDGRRTGITNTTLRTIGAAQVRSARVAFAAVLATPGDPDPGNLTEGVFVADLRQPAGTGGGGGGEPCEQCLECILIDCEFEGMLLGLGPDFDQSGLVDETDLNLMMMAWGYTKGRFDMNMDGIVNEKDLALVMEDYGKTVEQKQ